MESGAAVSFNKYSIVIGGESTRAQLIDLVLTIVYILFSRGLHTYSDILVNNMRPALGPILVLLKSYGDESEKCESALSDESGHFFVLHHLAPITAVTSG